MKVAVLGAGGLIGGHLVDRLIDEGHETVAIDIKPSGEWWQLHYGATNIPVVDLSDPIQAVGSICTSEPEYVFHLAADMGGIGHIETHVMDCALNTLITINVLRASARSHVRRLFYSSSACIYPAYAQNELDMPALKEDDAYPADAEPGYGWSKLYDELLCQYAYEDWGLETRVARYHNIYGPATWTGGREKAPAAICRKVAEAAISGDHSIEIWGDGSQQRSYCYVGDCIEGTLRIMDSDCQEPLNLGSDRLISVDDLVSLVENIAGIKLTRRYNLDAPQGVKGRNSDNTKLQETIGWVPEITLEDGMERLYSWVKDQVMKSQSSSVPMAIPSGDISQSPLFSLLQRNQ